jgi:hypothetical protein
MHFETQQFESENITWNFSEKKVQILWRVDWKAIFRLRVWWFLHFLQLLRHKNAPKQLLMFRTHETTQMTTKKFSKFLSFSIIFLKNMLKNNVCVNLTTNTSKYRVDVSQLSLQCFVSFLLRLLSKKSKHIFFRKFFHVTLKNSYFLFWVEIWQKRPSESFCLFRASFCKNLSKFWNLT